MEVPYSLGHAINKKVSNLCVLIVTCGRSWTGSVNERMREEFEFLMVVVLTPRILMSRFSPNYQVGLRR